MTFVKQWNRDIFMQIRFNTGENSLVCKYYWSVKKVLSDSKHRIMQKNQSPALNSLYTSTFPSSSVGKGRGFRHHWASDFLTGDQASLFFFRGGKERVPSRHENKGTPDRRLRISMLTHLKHCLTFSRRVVLLSLFANASSLPAVGLFIAVSQRFRFLLQRR